MKGGVQSVTDRAVRAAPEVGIIELSSRNPTSVEMIESDAGFIQAWERCTHGDDTTCRRAHILGCG